MDSRVMVKTICMFVNLWVYRFLQKKKAEHWLLQPLNESNLQLFVLISIWISCKVGLLLCFCYCFLCVCSLICVPRTELFASADALYTRFIGS